MPSTDVLQSFHSSDQSIPDLSCISYLDGILTGLACNPELELEGSRFGRASCDTEIEQAAIKSGIRDLLEEARIRLEADKRYVPVLKEGTIGNLTAKDWCNGFIDAVRLRPEPWDALSRTRMGAELLLPIRSHASQKISGSITPSGLRGEFQLAQDDLGKCLSNVVPALYRHIRLVTNN